MGITVYIAGVILSPILLLAALGFLAYGIYELWIGNWSEAAAVLLASLASCHLGSFLFKQAWDENGELRVP
jgi:hypothetical protein